MARQKRSTAKGARTWVGTLLVAWTFVSSGALVIATAYYQRTRDLEMLITWLAPPFLLGCILFGSMAIVALFGGVKEPEVEIVNQKGTRGGFFRER